MARQPTPEQVILGHRAALALVRSRVTAYARTAWIAQGSYRDADVDRLVSLIVPRVQAGQIQTANLTSSYIATLATVRRGRLVKATPIDRLAVTGGRGVPADDVYRRPANELYTQLSKGTPFTPALAMATARLGSLVATDMQMAMVRQADASYESAGVKFYQRVLGDGGKSGNCDLCITASTQRYFVGDLLPIHPGCSCSVEEMDAVSDPGQRIASKRFDDAPDVEVAVRDHSEYGPTLTNAADHFSTAADLAA